MGFQNAQSTPAAQCTGTKDVARVIRRALIETGRRQDVQRSHQALSPLARLHAQDVIARCSTLAHGNDPRESTRKDYAKKFAFLTRHLGHDGANDDAETWMSRLIPYLGSRDSFRGYKAAVRWGLKQQILRALEVQAQMAQHRAHVLSWQRVVWQLENMLNVFHTLGAASIDDVFWSALEVERRESTSKKEDLRKLNRRRPGWLRQFLMAMRRTKYFDAMRALILLGCRPEELRKGIILRKAGNGQIEVEVEGAKVTATSGQPWRTFTFDVNALPAAWRHDLSTADSVLIEIESKDALRASMAEVSERLFPDLPRVTPYVLRHLFASRMREGGIQAEDLAAAMGHLVSETQKVYGFRKGGGARRKAPSKRLPISVETARHVKPLDRSGLGSISGGTHNRPG